MTKDLIFGLVLGISSGSILTFLIMADKMRGLFYDQKTMIETLYKAFSKDLEDMYDNWRYSVDEILDKITKENKEEIENG